MLLCLANISIAFGTNKTKVKTGIDVLKETNFKILKNQKVGLITNPTGVDSNLKSTIDILHEAEGVDLVALFAPEHGVRGDFHAGDVVEDLVDEATGTPIYSLHGKHKVPTAEMLEGIDVLIYDIQDIGCRSYTFISTMGLSMKAAAENNVKFVVLDRPNPLGGNRIEGGSVDDDVISFVSQFKIPYLYGLTCGELALYLNSENILGVKCDLEVVAMKGWKRKMLYEDTGLQWVMPSPHIPHPASAIFYPVSGILGELYYMSIGVGYTIPFQMFAAEWINADEFTNALNDLKLPGVTFRPIHAKPFYSTNQGKNIQGSQVYIMDYDKAGLSDIQFYVMQVVAKLYPEHNVFNSSDEKRFRMFDQVAGSKQVRETFEKNPQYSAIKKYWTSEAKPFKKVSKKYYLYK